MRKIITIVAFMALFMCSCEEYIAEQKRQIERQVMSIERDKVPFMLQKYKNMGINVNDIYLDTVVMNYESTPYWGYLKTVWTIDNSSDDDLLFESNFEKRSVFIELEINEDNNLMHKAYWPETNPFEK